jgi:alkylation response protein AidB-like acyl-CoA dehydrogenase
MDLAFTPEEQAFREEIRAWVHANLPKDISHKVHNALRLSRDDMQRWAKILGKKGWLGHGWPKEFGGPGWNAVQKHLFEEECALAGAPRVVPFGPVMVAPVIMAFGNKEQQQTVFFWKLLERLLNSLTELLGLEDTQGIVRDSSGGFPDRVVRIAEHVPVIPGLLEVAAMIDRDAIKPGAP